MARPMERIVATSFGAQLARLPYDNLLRVATGHVSIGERLLESIADYTIALMNGTQGGMSWGMIGAMTWREMQFWVDRVVNFQEQSRKRVKQELRDDG